MTGFGAPEPFVTGLAKVAIRPPRANQRVRPARPPSKVSPNQFLRQLDHRATSPRSILSQRA